MPRNTFVTPEPVVLDGYQAVMQPSKFGYSLKAIVDDELIHKLEDDRADLVKWCESKLKNPKRSVQRPEPWEEVSEGKYIVKFSWNEEAKPPIVDTEGTPVTDTRTPIFSGSQVKLAFYQKPYVLKDQTTYGTSLKLVGVQVVTCNGQAGVDTGDMAPADVADLFGKTQGFKTSEPNVTTHDEDDF
tara:strand:- start:528 stop:1085 length:558 start_codon:yes stop_codon:yes gene_type:complete